MSAPVSAIVYGCFSIDGQLLELERREDTLLLRVSRVLAIHQSGRSPLLHCIRNDDAFEVAFGRLFDTGGLAVLTENAPQCGAAAAVGIRVSGAKSGNPSLELVADRYGLRPLFYAKRRATLYFATHLQGIVWQIGELPGIPDDDLLHYYHFGFTRNDRTLFTGIEKVPPGHTLEVSRAGAALRRYFHVADLYQPVTYADMSESALAGKIGELLGNSVRKWLSGDQVAAVALSGGVDSGLIAASVARSGAPFRAYTLTFKDRYSEADRIRTLSQRFGFAIETLVTEPEHVLDAFRTANSLCSEPAPFNSAIMGIVAAAAARDGAATLFDGDGADRLFLGMNRYRQYVRLLSAHRVLKTLGLAKLAGRLLLLSRSPEHRKAGKLFLSWDAGLRPYPERTLQGAAAFDLRHEQHVYEIAVARHEAAFRASIRDGDFGLFFTYVSALMCPEMFFQAPAEMQEPLGLSPAPAFWDDELVSLALSIPTSLKLRGRDTKYILRKAAAAILGDDYAFLPKIGLQSASSFLFSAEIGQRWRNDAVTRIRESHEFDLLRRALPGGTVDVDRLLPLHQWLQSWRHAAATTASDAPKASTPA